MSGPNYVGNVQTPVQPQPTYYTNNPNHGPAKPPAVAPVVIWTLLFGVFGIFSVLRRAGKARSMGAKTGNYWIAFAATFGAQVVLSIILMTTVFAAAVATSPEAFNNGVVQGQHAAGGNGPEMTMAEFTSIKNGMTLAQVQAIVGSAGEVLSETDGGEMRTWDGNTFASNANVTFVGGKVYAKAQLGLE